ncbi:hypothetical protein JTE90_004153 [Oedothorax gibbosus]|uniref:Uncharacterized protein n=1 Tax=Oedothorax gibbosus TaxID=931172 RepID=A0AAV6TVH2_9ARAC|nr:hypothetical protein JTE90_004153 [Oedothorax gibbosus]
MGQSPGNYRQDLFSHGKTGVNDKQRRSNNLCRTLVIWEDSVIQGESLTSRNEEMGTSELSNKRSDPFLCQLTTSTLAIAQFSEDPLEVLKQHHFFGTFVGTLLSFLNPIVGIDPLAYHTH